MFRLGNFVIDEVLYLVNETLDGKLIFTADELSSAQIEISAESTDITDKKGNVVRTKYRAKTGTFTATSAMLHPALLNASSGSELQNASASNVIAMPRIAVVEAGKSVDVSDAEAGTIKVIGLFGSGANGDPMSDADIAAQISGGVFTAPAQVTAEDPIQYLVKYYRNVESGIMIVNDAEKFPEATKTTLSCSYLDPCGDLKACYVVMPRTVFDPSQTIAFDAENQTLDITAQLNVEYCSTSGKILYYIYFPEVDAVVPGEITG